MKKLLSCLMLWAALAQPAYAQPPVWGVFHSIHTTVSDGTESLSQRTDNLGMYYDFASTVDHDVMIDNAEWLQTVADVNTNQDFLYFVGYEWLGTSSHSAEVTAFFTGDPPMAKVDGNDPNYDTFGEFATWLSANNGMGCVNHPARADNTVMWVDPGVRNEQIYPCVEMLNKQDYHWSDQWLCAEGSGCTTYNNPSPPARADWRGSVKNALDSGLELGFVAGWDYHGGYPGIPTAYTGLVGVTEWTKEAVVEAVRRRHTWAAEDRIRMNVTSGPYVMGDTFISSGEIVPIDYDISAAPGKTLIQVSIFVDGIITQVYPFSGQENVVGGVDLGLPANRHYVFLEAIQSDGKRAWSSPMYITPCGSVVTRDVRVSAYSDDAEEQALSGEMYLTSTDLELINDSEWWGQQLVGIRFSGVGIPQDATIRNAYIQFKVDETSAEATSLVIAGENIDNAVTFATSPGNISSRARTSAAVVWSPVAWTTVGQAGLDQRTPDLSSTVREIVNRPGWSSGNSIAFIITGIGKRVAVAYDGDRTGAPLLHVEYKDACPVDNPVPTTTSLSPSTAIAGGGTFVLTLNGSNFIAGSTVRWNGSNRTTTYVSGTQLTAAIPASDLTVAGTAQVAVYNPTPGGGASNAQAFTINNPLPTTTSLSPSSAVAGGLAFTLTVNGSGFVASSGVRWNGAVRTTTFVSSTQLTAAIPASDLTVAGTAQVTVYTPTPGGGTSNAQVLTINNSVPSTMHIGDLDGTSQPAGFKWWNAIATITVHDQNHRPVQNTIVKGAWSGGASGTDTCTTDITGSCFITSSRIKNTTPTVKFAVTAVTSSSLRYDSIVNHDPDGDSTGTSIVILK